jgi:hypothetical protein
MADGSTYTRVWDASRYPKHYLYIGNERVDQNEFEEGDEWVVNEEPRENSRFQQTALENRDSRTPFNPHIGSAYERNYDRDSNTTSPPGDRTPEASGPHPVMDYVIPGTVLSKEDLINHEAFVEPHFPWR